MQILYRTTKFRCSQIFFFNVHLRPNALHSKFCRIEAVTKALKEMDLNDEQRTNMTEFLEDKRKIIQHGELKEGDFVRLAELGYGNGGVVLKVEHKPSHTTMARKVCS